MMYSIDISKLSKKTGLPASTIRFYEEKNLIKSIGRSGLKRAPMAMASRLQEGHAKQQSS